MTDFWVCDIHDEDGEGRFDCKACRDTEILDVMLSHWLPDGQGNKP
jgi:hypothetical protein